MLRAERSKHMPNAALEVIKDIVYMPVGTLNPVAFNPPTRTAPKAISRLQEEIEKHGILAPIHILHRPPEHVNTIVDGHRRTACAQVLKQKTVPCVIHTKGEAADIWATLNRVPTKVSGYDWMVAYVLSGYKAVPSQSTLALIREAAEIFGGITGLKYLIKHEVSPKVVTNINIIFNHMVDRKLSPRPTRLQIGQWMIKHRMQNPAYEMVRACTREGSRRNLTPTLKRIAKAILSDKSLTAKKS
jgi:hypothetical protein